MKTLKNIKKQQKLLLAGAAALGVLLGAGALAGHLAGRAAASGIPQTDPLFYSGVLADTSGKLLSGTRTIAVDLHTAQTGGTKACSTAGKSTTLTQGRFRVALSSSCVQAVQTYPDLWVEVTVDGTAMGRQKIGAVPYAAEARAAAEPDCPPGYAKDSTVTLFTLCKKGSDEMVKVGPYWIDRYEVSLVDSTAYSGGKCDGTGTQYGAGSTDDYPSTFPDSGNWSTRVHACSLPGNVPSRSMTWFQAQQACLLAGKTLCTNAQWQGAAAGTYDAGSYDGSAGGSCHTNGTAPRKTGLAGSVPTASTSCISSWGAEDMIGNLREWVDLWGQAGMSWMTVDGETASPWPSGYGDAKDTTRNVNGRAANPGWVNGAPFAAERGGAWSTGIEAGVFSITFAIGPGGREINIGARCCRD